MLSAVLRDPSARALYLLAGLAIGSLGLVVLIARLALRSRERLPATGAEKLQLR